MLQRQITTPAYSYNGDGAVTYTATARLLSPTGVVLADLSVSSTQNVRAPGWQSAIVTDVRAQIDSYEAALLDTMARVQSAFPAAQTPADMLAAITAYIEQEVNSQ